MFNQNVKDKIDQGKLVLLGAYLLRDQSRATVSITLLLFKAYYNQARLETLVAQAIEAFSRPYHLSEDEDLRIIYPRVWAKLGAGYLILMRPEEYDD